MKRSNPIYLDHNATTPCDPEVVKEMLPFFSEHFGNAASSHHAYGWNAAAAVDEARERVAALIGAEPGEIIFTSGATESDNLAIKGVFDMYASKGAHIITSTTEHKAVLDTCRHLEKKGATVTYLPVDARGMISLSGLEASIRPDTILIALMYANNETGVLLPVEDIGRMARKHGVLFFTDASQAVGKVPVDVNRDQADLMAFTAHKLYGPKGVGALYVRRKNPRVKLTAQMDGGGHEKGMRSGTLNVPGIVGFGKACALCMQSMEEESQRLRALRNRLESALLLLEGSSVNGDPDHRLPHVSNISFRQVDSEGVLTGLKNKLALSSGSACTSGSLEPSYVLKAMGLEDELARGSLRFGLGRSTTVADVDLAIGLVSETVVQLRKMNINLNCEI